MCFFIIRRGLLNAQAVVQEDTQHPNAVSFALRVHPLSVRRDRQSHAEQPAHERAQFTADDAHTQNKNNTIK